MVENEKEKMKNGLPMRRMHDLLSFWWALSLPAIRDQKRQMHPQEQQMMQLFMQTKVYK